VYSGPVADGSKFDPTMLSAVVVQVKNTIAGNKKAGAVRPIGIPRDPCQPLPYIAMLLELGSESLYKESKSKREVNVPTPMGDVGFQELIDHYSTAVGDLRKYREGEVKKRKKVEAEMIKTIETRREAMDAYNRYSIFVRGASSDIYGILKTADIVDQFGTLLHVTMPSPDGLESSLQHMWPLERLGNDCAQTAWMLEYVTAEEL
jgi:hypothetical protein